MNKQLELEAQEYILDMDAEFYKDGINEHEIREFAKKDFIAGATSKWVEKQKLEFAMSMLNRAKDLDLQTVYFELKQKLSEL